MNALHTAVESVDDPGAAEEAQWMRAVVVGLLRDSGPASSGGSARAQQGSAAETPPAEDDSLLDGLPLDGDLCELQPAGLDDLLADPEVTFGWGSACPPLLRR